MNSQYSSNPSTFNQFSANRLSGVREFLSSNSAVAKFAFILLIIFLFIILLQIGVSLIAWYITPPTSPKLIDGMVDATQMLIFPQDPTNTGAMTIARSVNDNSGIEFTWSIWIYIVSLPTSSTHYQHIFSKGNADLDPNTGLNTPNNAPGLYIKPNTNTLAVIMNTYNVINEEIDIPDIPLNKWVNVIIRCQNTTLDIYINGLITQSLALDGVPKQNYGDVYVAQNGGFTGNISNLWYYDYGLGTAAIQALVKNGPNINAASTAATGTGMNLVNPNYLSLRWYFAGSNDMYNP